MRLAHLLAFALAAAASPALARYAMQQTEDVPLPRLIAHYETRLSEKPEDARSHAVLARLHAMSYAAERESLRIRTNVLNGFGHADDSIIGETSPLSGPPASPAPSAAPRDPGALKKAIEHYREADRLAPHTVVTRMGLGWCLEQAGDKPGAATAYRDALKSAHATKTQNGWHDRSLTVECGEALKRLLDPGLDAAELATVESQVAAVKVQGEKNRVISPIVLPLGPRHDLASLIDHARAVAFDLDGRGPTTRWTWVTPDAGWLVWDPRGTGRITSGRQLFGSITFWVLWRDGYEALSALDDDDDGQLAGAELAGLALWRDADGDGRSDPGEVRPLAAWGVTALATGARRHATGIPFNPAGARLSSGQFIPTYDLMPHASMETRVALRAAP